MAEPRTTTNRSAINPADPCAIDVNYRARSRYDLPGPLWLRSGSALGLAAFFSRRTAESFAMSTKSRERLYGSSIRHAAEQAALARKKADALACEAWNKRMLGYKGPAQPSPTIADAINAGFGYLEVRCLGCETSQTVALDIIRRDKHKTCIHELERYMRCKSCSDQCGYPYKRSALVALRGKKITASDPPSAWWPGER